jgi:molybdopterin synthase catalytic subunit
LIKVSSEEIDTGRLIEAAKQPDTGALVVFTGIARDDGIERIELEAYEEAAVMELEKIRNEAMDTYPVSSVSIVHRTGSLFVGETILVIIVGAPHRKEAFDACRYVIERIKQSVPIWKKEYRKDGCEWVRGEYPEWIE